MKKNWIAVNIRDPIQGASAKLPITISRPPRLAGAPHHAWRRLGASSSSRQSRSSPKLRRGKGLDFPVGIQPSWTRASEEPSHTALVVNPPPCRTPLPPAVPGKTELLPVVCLKEFLHSPRPRQCGAASVLHGLIPRAVLRGAIQHQNAESPG